MNENIINITTAGTGDVTQAQLVAASGAAVITASGGAVNVANTSLVNASGLFLKRDGSTSLTADWPAGPYKISCSGINNSGNIDVRETTYIGLNDSASRIVINENRGFYGPTISIKDAQFISWSTSAFVGQCSIVDLWCLKGTFNRNFGGENFTIEGNYGLASYMGPIFYGNTNNNLVGIGTYIPAAKLELVQDDDDFPCLMLNNSSGIVDERYARIVLKHKIATEEPLTMVYGSCAGGSPYYSTLKIGGGHTAGNCFSFINFVTANDGITPTGTIAMTVHNNQSVGIGTTEPISKLDVSGVITASGGNSTLWNAGAAFTSASGLFLKKNGTTELTAPWESGPHSIKCSGFIASGNVRLTNIGDGIVICNTGVIGTTPNHSTQWDTGIGWTSASGLFLKKDGTTSLTGDWDAGAHSIIVGNKIGIATSNLSDRLVIGGSVSAFYFDTDGAYPRIRVSGNTSFVFNWNNSQAFYFGETTNVGNMYFRHAGFTGFGTVSPASKLDVNGIITASGYAVPAGTGWTGTFTEHTGKTVTVVGGIITNVA